MNKSETIVKIVKDSGLSEPLAKTYCALLKQGNLTATKISGITGETRTNTYALLEKLEEMNLIKSLNNKKVKTYSALPPANLEIYAEKQRREAMLHEQNLKSNLNSLTELFYSNNALPGSRTVFGLEGVKDAYRDVLRVQKDVYLLYAPVDRLLSEFIHKYRNIAAKKGIKTYALTLDNAKSRRNHKLGKDEMFLMDRVIMPANQFDAPVNLMVYGHKIVAIDYSNPESIATTTITSPVLAEAMRQILIILRDLWRDNYPQLS